MQSALSAQLCLLTMPGLDLAHISLTRASSSRDSALSSPRSPNRRPGLREKSSGFFVTSAARVKGVFSVISPSKESPPQSSSSSTPKLAKELKQITEKERKHLTGRHPDPNKSAFRIASLWPSSPGSNNDATTRLDTHLSTANNVGTGIDDLSGSDLFDAALYAMRFVSLYALAPPFEKPRDTTPSHLDALPVVATDWLRLNEHDAREVIHSVSAHFGEKWRAVRRNECGVLDRRNERLLREEVLSARHFNAANEVREIMRQDHAALKSSVRRLERARDELERYEEMVSYQARSPEEKVNFRSYLVWKREYERYRQQGWSSGLLTLKEF